ncbi:MAG: DUF669 domain-containing protein [Phycisphaera sp.]|nr:MAG: DUF669 domain-containing protein [Phycisphaera sp.]
MADLNGFDATQVEPAGNFAPLPAGQYLCAAVDSQMKPTKKGDGKYLQVELEVLEGEHKGRKLWDRFVLEHPNERTVAIAKSSLASLCTAVGVTRPRDSAELHNVPVLVRVACTKRNDTGEITNTVKGYAKRGGSHTAPANTASSTGGGVPWRK